MDINYRAANQSDASAIASLHTQSWQNTYHTMLKAEYLSQVAPSERLTLWQSRFATENSKQHVIIASHQSKLVGFICVYADHNAELGSLLDNLHVDGHYHGNGIAKRLMSMATQWLQANATHPSIYLEVLSGNHHAIKVYEKLGAKRVKAGVWHAPCGSVVDEFVYQWSDKTQLSEYQHSV
ncbi:GNAT family N-acetyltransferase [Pseudoalteromonas spongiae]|uniref:GNAT family N-acetyltransferase n=1 Tax=Pseudoalteromonas spongiae TaxID=298657 RepID=UPI000C2D35F2|nr:GNAT family N-acetyltransferase [Pseudoalteromonas spongiae]